jgi:hypothetical protein
MTRPALSDFVPREGQWFEARHLEEEVTRRWKLEAIKTFNAPDEEELRELDCFMLTFKHEEAEVLPQGIHHLTSEDGFETTLFATPFQNNEMIITIN